MATGKDVRRFMGHTALVRVIQFSTDGTFILTASDDTTARLWPIDAGMPVP